MRIVITSSRFDLANLPPELADQDVIVNRSGRRPTREELLALLADGADGVIAGLERFDADILARVPMLRAISRIGTGLDSIDLDAAHEHGVRILRTPEAPTAAVAELTLGLMLAGLRHLVPHHEGVVSGMWRARPGGLLQGRTVGLVGAGRIARAVAERLAPFGAVVRASDPFVAPSEVPFPLVELEELLRTSSIVSLHVPADPTTDGLLDATRIALLPPGAMVINTARGGLVDEAALADALRGGRVGFAGFDAFVEEPYAGPLLGLEGVLLTPHVGSNTVETRWAMEREAGRNLAEALGLTTDG